MNNAMVEGWNEIADGVQILIEEGAPVRVSVIGDADADDVARVLAGHRVHVADAALWGAGEADGESVAPLAPLQLTWELFEAGDWYDTVAADDRDEAIEIAKGNVDRDNYYDADGTLWVDLLVRCVQTGEEETATVQLDPEEPDCAKGHDHDWQTPSTIVGGLKGNPGVFGHGAGIILHEVCTICGCGRVTDTYAQRPDDGTHGYTTVRYQPGAYADEVESRFHWRVFRIDDESRELIGTEPTRDAALETVASDARSMGADYMGSYQIQRGEYGEPEAV